MTSRRALLIGGSGQLGSDLIRCGGDRWEFVAPPHRELDIADQAAVGNAVTQLRPELIVNCSAFHVVDLCESRFADALLVNAVAVAALARAAERVRARLVTVSTDYVFDGTASVPYREEKPVGPLQCYGISKVAGEFAARAAHPEGAMVIRSCGLYGLASSQQKSGNFVLNRLKDAATRASVEVGCDLVCTPTSSLDLAESVLRLVDAEAAAGVYHVTNGGACDWAEFTTEIFRAAGVATRAVPVDRQGRYAPARRPAYTVLDCGKATALGVVMPPWQDALARYVRQVTG